MAKKTFQKPPLSFRDQIQKLKSRGLIFKDDQLAEFYLSHINYYRFAAYCLPFEQNHSTHSFKVGTTFEEIWNLYIFDRELRLLVLDAIERFEVSLRTQMAYHLSLIHKTAHPHLRGNLFDNQNLYNESLNKLRNDIQISREDFIQHLTRTYQESLPPIWACVELMTMGQLSKWYGNIAARSDRQNIAKIYQVDEKILSSFCQHITIIRNCCAHHARLWNRDFVKTMKLPKNGNQALINSLDIPPKTQPPPRKIYNTLVMLLHLMNVINPEHHWKKRICDLIETHKIDVSKMGFPQDWKQREIWEI